MEKKKEERTQKPVKKGEKFIWFAVSIIIAFVGYIIRTSDFVQPIWLKILFPAALLFTIIIAAQKTSTERFALAGNKSARSRYILISVLYYIFIIFAVFYVFLSLWVSGVLSI